MKRVGILTTYFAANYGAMLQPFALKRVLEQEGCEVEMIRYEQKDISHSYNPFYWGRFFQSNLSAALAAVLFLPWAWTKEKRFRRFCRRYINPTPGFVDQVPADKDYYFIGSDQLWRTFGRDEHFDEVYMGYFQVKEGAKKISYAVSGEHLALNAENQEYLRKAFRNFDLISVREESRAHDFAPLAEGKQIEVVLDPTLLAEPALYQELESRNPLPNTPFVLFYCVRRSQHFVHKIYAYAREHQCHLLIFSEGFKPSLIRFAATHADVHYQMTAGEESFLGAMKNAYAVFTPSFHGTAFAIINHKRLYALLLDDGHDHRPQELLQNLGMADRLLRLDTPIGNADIQYEAVEAKLGALRKHSKDFIQRALSL